MVAVANNFKSTDKMKAITDANGSRPVPKWLEVDQEKLTSRVAQLPAREDIDLDVEEHLIVELYSK